MNAQQYNFGLNGQPVAASSYVPADKYDHFLCLSKKCKDRVAAKKKVRQAKREERLEKKKLKNEMLRADIEAKRTETKLASQLGAPSPEPQTAATISTGGGGGQPSAQPQQAGFGGGTIMIVVGVLLVGGFLWQQAQKNKAVPVAQAA
ncbi:MAG: hypothetical protein H6585_10115 [Flavobacteriales bacterium]|nr:hypothetical protein [Flavobacteriales bacterium]